MDFLGWDLMVNKYININKYNRILYTELYIVEKVQEPSVALCLALIKWANHTDFNEDIPVSTKGNPMTTVFVEVFQAPVSCSRNFWGKNYKLRSIVCLIIRFNKEGLIKSQGKWRQISYISHEMRKVKITGWYLPVITVIYVQVYSITA